MLAAGIGAVALAYTLFIPPARPAGTLLVLATSTTGDAVTTRLPIALTAGPRVDLDISGPVPRAPEQRQLRRVSVEAGNYVGLRVGSVTVTVPVRIGAGQVEPLLLVFDRGGLVTGGVYAGNDEVNLGLQEAAGLRQPLPDFSLIDQQGRPFTNQSVLGQDTVFAAFHTTCHETCPLYTGLLLQLRQKVGSGVRIVEVTTDPINDTPAVLAAYAQRVGADWTFLTGSPQQVAAFWKPFGVNLSGGDSHESTLFLVDRHGYQRLFHRGVPDTGGNLPPALLSQLDVEGLGELNSHGHSWDAQAVADELAVIAGLTPAAAGTPDASVGRPAPAFAGVGFDGRPVSLDQFRGRPVVLNFFASWCGPCQDELPLLQSAAVDNPRVQFVLVDSRDTNGPAILAATHVTRPAVLNDYNAAVNRAYQVSLYPTTYFIRADGTVEGVVRGQLDAGTLRGHLSALVPQ